MPIYLFRVFCISAVLAATGLTVSLAQAEDAPFQPNWESLSKHEAAPEWFRGTKLGIYFHWGVYSVPAHASDRYPRLMHLPGHGAYKHHLEKYGHPSKFGYHDFVSMFNGDNRVNWMSHYPLFERMPPVSADPRLSMLYGKLPEQEWLENVWLAKLKVTAVSLLGCDEKIDWKQTNDGFSVTLPHTKISDIAVAFKVTSD